MNFRKILPLIYPLLNGILFLTSNLYLIISYVKSNKSWDPLPTFSEMCAYYPELGVYSIFIGLEIVTTAFIMHNRYIQLKKSGCFGNIGNIGNVDNSNISNSSNSLNISSNFKQRPYVVYIIHVILVIVTCVLIVSSLGVIVFSRAYEPIIHGVFTVIFIASYFLFLLGWVTEDYFIWKKYFTKNINLLLYFLCKLFIYCISYIILSVILIISYFASKNKDIISVIEYIGLGIITSFYFLLFFELFFEYKKRIERDQRERKKKKMKKMNDKYMADNSNYKYLTDK